MDFINTKYVLMTTKKLNFDKLFHYKIKLKHNV